MLSEVDVDTLWLAVIGVLLGGMLLLGALLCHHAGLFHSLRVRTARPAYGEMVVMYKVGRGCYSGCGPLFTETHSLLPQYHCVGVYYDDPSKKPKAGLRYLVGAVLSSDGAPVCEEDRKTFLEHGYRSLVLPAVSHAVCCDHPFTGTLSCIAAVFRVYPVMREYIAQRELCAHPFLEVYDGAASTVRFMAPLEQQSSFYVPEVLADEAGLTDEQPSCESSEEESSLRDDSVAAESSLRDDIVATESSVRCGSVATESSVRCGNVATESSHDGSTLQEKGQEDVNKSDSNAEDNKESSDKESKNGVKDGESVPRSESWEQSASLISGDEDSETNTASSFEEIEIPSVPPSPLDPSPPCTSPLDPSPPSHLPEEAPVEESKENQQ